MKIITSVRPPNGYGESGVPFAEVAAERSSAYGRNFICGVAEIAKLHPEWDMALVDPEPVSSKAYADINGWICRVTGVDDDPIYCMFSSPRLSSIDPDSVAIGRTAARTLADMLADSRIAADPQNLTVPPKGIVKRTSTDTYPDAPPWFAEVMFFIRANVTKNISASDVFRHVGYSRTLVERAFRRHISSSVQRKIAEARIDEAKRMFSPSFPL